MILILCRSYPPVQPGAYLLTQPVWENIIITKSFLVTDILSQMPNYPLALQIPLDLKPRVETLPHVAGAQRASLTLQELQMNRNAAIGFFFSEKKCF